MEQKPKVDLEQWYQEKNKKLKNRLFQDLDESEQRKLNSLTLKNWHRRVNPVDMAYADALALGGYEFFVAYASGALDSEFATSVLKALRKREAQHEAKIIQAIIATSSASVASGLKGNRSMRSKVNKLDKTLNQEAYDGD